ncbi:hypothetical protein KvSKV_10190 [Ketogulonicigenium vulgare]|nr:hypothetical protein KvSKV_10190 [Ketogulonicigenium vulgare]
MFAALTCDPNATIVRIHPKAMPVILTQRAALRTWLRAGLNEARALQNPIKDEF